MLKSARVIVVGGTSGIGLETARRAAEQGATVIVLGRDNGKLEAARALGLEAAQLDVADNAGARDYFASCGAFDHLVVCASGAAGSGAFRDLPLDDLRRGFEGKFWPQLNALQAALQTLQPRGSVTLVSAISSRALQPGTAGLAAINAALEAMVPILASELRPLRVNAVAPGVVETPWWDRVPEAQRRVLFDQMAAAVPAGRVGRPEDIAEAILLLINNTFITGSVIDCDGGWKLKGA